MFCALFWIIKLKQKNNNFVIIIYLQFSTYKNRVFSVQFMYCSSQTDYNSRASLKLMTSLTQISLDLYNSVNPINFVRKEKNDLCTDHISNCLDCL